MWQNINWNLVTGFHDDCIAMPLFTNKFAPKKIPVRRYESSVVARELGPEVASRELGLEIPPIALTISKHDLVFADGQWTIGSVHKEDPKTKKSMKCLEEENNLMKLKFEILLDMLTQTTAESQIRLKQIEQLKRAEKTKTK